MTDRRMYSPNDEVVITDFEEESVLLHLGTGVYYGLDEVGTEVWRMLAEGQAVDDVVRSLLRRYEADEEALAADVRRLVADLHKADLVRAT